MIKSIVTVSIAFTIGDFLLNLPLHVNRPNDFRVQHYISDLMLDPTSLTPEELHNLGKQHNFVEIFEALDQTSMSESSMALWNLISLIALAQNGRLMTEEEASHFLGFHARTYTAAAILESGLHASRNYANLYGHTDEHFDNWLKYIDDTIRTLLRK